MRGFWSMLVLAAALPGAPAPAQQSYGDMVQFLTAAGFPVKDGHTTNRCGQATRPVRLPLDINGDGVKDEMILVDKGPCYTIDGAFFSLLARSGAGAPWRLLYAHEGSLAPAPTYTAKWRDVVMTSGGVRTMLHYTGVAYAAAGGGPASALAAATAIPETPLASPGGAWPDAGWKLPIKPAAIPVPALAAIMKAVGAHKVGAKWQGGGGACNTITLGDPVTDINGDGHADVIAIGETDACGGVPGGEYTLLSATPGGWKEISRGLGYPGFTKHRGPGGWPDMIEGGPRICNPVSRWNGKEYVAAGFSDGEKPCTPG